MGIPRLQRWLESNFPSAFSRHEGSIEADHVYIDLNEFFHKVLGALGAQPAEAVFLSAVTKQLDELFGRVVVRSNGTVYLAIDGPAAVAKVPEQRRRRRDRAGQCRSGCVCANMLTPGVPFMERLSAEVEKFCASRLGVAVKLSNASAPGEGEHKVLSEMSTRHASDSTQVSSGSSPLHLVIGSDSDLALLCVCATSAPARLLLAAPVNQMQFRICNVDGLRKSIVHSSESVVPAAPESDDEEDLEGKTKKQLKMICHDANVPGDGNTTVLRERIIAHRKKSTETATNTKPDVPLAPSDLELSLRNDFAVIMLMRGNDYLPSLRSRFDPDELWPQYLKWRQGKSPATGLVGIQKDSKGNGTVSTTSNTRGQVVFCLQTLSAFMEAVASTMECVENASLSIPEGEDTSRCVTLYLRGLMWCLETYFSGWCAHFRYRIEPKDLVCLGASAVRIAKVAPTLKEDDIKECRGVSTAIAPLTCAVATLPVLDARSLLTPTFPGLMPLLEGQSPVFAAVVQLETCTHCTKLKRACDEAERGNKAAKCRRLLDEHRQEQHADIDSVVMDDLDAEVVKCCSDRLPAENAEVQRQDTAPSAKKPSKVSDGLKTKPGPKARKRAKKALRVKEAAADS